jgi:hypothetical protein
MRRVIVLLALAAAATGCSRVVAGAAALSGHTTRADDAVLYDTPKLQMRVVRYREYYPFSNIGYSYSVECARKGETWTRLTTALDSVSPSAAAIAKSLRETIRVYNDDIVVWDLWGHPRVSADGCKTFRLWLPTSIDASLIDPAPIWPKEKEPAPLEAKPWFCAKPDTDCREWEFGGERRLHYANAAVLADGTISFDVSSRAFRKVRLLHVESHDWGLTWSYRPVE